MYSTIIFPWLPKSLEQAALDGETWQGTLDNVVAWRCCSRYLFYIVIFAVFLFSYACESDLFLATWLLSCTYHTMLSTLMGPFLQICCLWGVLPGLVTLHLAPS